MDTFPTAKFCLPALSRVLTGPRLSPRLRLAILESRIRRDHFDKTLSKEIDRVTCDAVSRKGSGKP